MIHKAKAENKPIGAIIVEPIQWIDTKSATPWFYKRVRALAREEGIPVIADETKLGLGITGKMYAVDNWNLSDPVDFLTFGSENRLAGYFHTRDSDVYLPNRSLSNQQTN